MEYLIMFCINVLAILVTRLIMSTVFVSTKADQYENELMSKIAKAVVKEMKK